MRPTGRFRIVCGSVRDLIFDRSGRFSGFCYREGWWWACAGNTENGLPYDPEGAFATKESARRHLQATLAGREGRVRGVRWGMNWRGSKRPSMRPIPCNQALSARVGKAVRAEIASMKGK